MEALKHPFIVQMKYAFQNPQKLYFCLEYCPGGEIFFHLSRVGNFDEEVTRFYAAQILLAMRYLHTNDIIHRDLKPENVLIDSTGYIKITDFGLSKANITSDKDGKSFCGTPEYLAPEVLAREGYGRPVDWWSFGSILFEMLTGVPPFYEQDREKLFNSIKNDDPDYPAELSENCVDLLKGLLTKDPNKRLGCDPNVPKEQRADDIMQHPWFSIVDWEALYEKKIVPPFKPKLSGDDDTKYIDSEFTELEPIDSATGETVLAGSAHKWDGFTYEGKNELVS